MRCYIYVTTYTVYYKAIRADLGGEGEESGVLSDTTRPGLKTTVGGAHIISQKSAIS